MRALVLRVEQSRRARPRRLGDRPALPLQQLLVLLVM